MLGRTVCKSMVTFLSDITCTFVFRRSLHDPMKTAVVIFGIKTGFRFRRRVAAADDPAGTTVARAGRLHRVLVVVAARLAREPLFTVAEDDAILYIQKRTTKMNELISSPNFGGQARQRDVGTQP